ncbi:MAG TPA: hypothetical protein VF053_02770 [Streptosporangiales bacterium]
MAEVERLVTVVEEDASPGSDEAFTALLFAVLTDGSRILLLGDRGWAQTIIRAASAPDVVEPAPSVLHRQDIEETARMVVGPDEPRPGVDAETEAAAHWRHLAGSLARHGVAVTGDELRALPHDVELSDALAARVR